MRSIGALRNHAALTIRRFGKGAERLTDGVPGFGSPVKRWVKVTGYAIGGTAFTARLVMPDGSIDTVDKTVGVITYPAVSALQTGQPLADCTPPVEVGEFIELRDAAPPAAVVGTVTVDYWAAMEFTRYGC